MFTDLIASRKSPAKSRAGACVFPQLRSIFLYIHGNLPEISFSSFMLIIAFLFALNYCKLNSVHLNTEPEYKLNTVTNYANANFETL